MATYKQLEKENAALHEELDELKEQFNQVRETILASYELMPDEPFETESDGDEDEDNVEE
jgi:hypothetical protein